jgi:hypothetical protein
VDFTVKAGFKLLGKLETKDIRKRADDLKKAADEKGIKAVVEQSDAFIAALESFDKLTPGLEDEINAIAKRFESQMKQVGEKFDTICEESCKFHFYDIEGAVKLAQKALDDAVSARGALSENALDIPAAIGRSVLRTSQDAGIFQEGMEKEFTRINAPTIDLALHEVQQRMVGWKTREQKLDGVMGNLLAVRQKALQALADADV